MEAPRAVDTPRPSEIVTTRCCASLPHVPLPRQKQSPTLQPITEATEDHLARSSPVGSSASFAEELSGVVDYFQDADDASLDNYPAVYVKRGDHRNSNIRSETKRVVIALPSDAFDPR